MEEKKHKNLITVDLDYGEVYVDLHENLTVNEAINKVKADTNKCFALTPHEALSLAKVLLDAVFAGKSKTNEQEK